MGIKPHANQFVNAKGGTEKAVRVVKKKAERAVIKRTLRQQIYKIDDPVEPVCGGHHPMDYIHSSDEGTHCCLWCEAIGQELRLREKILKLESYVAHKGNCDSLNPVAFWDPCSCGLIEALES